MCPIGPLPPWVSLARTLSPHLPETGRLKLLRDLPPNHPLPLPYAYPYPFTAVNCRRMDW